MNELEPAKNELQRGPFYGWAAAEIALIFLLFFLAAGWPTPDVNEAHYLAKAKHYWNPDWCADDHFLDSADAHLMFYWSLGWLTRFLPLPAVAWVGRIISWGLLAWAWQRLSFALVPRRLAAVLSASSFLVLSNFGHMAGEWIVGGVEAKGFAFVFVLLALTALVRDRWRTAWLLLGVATAFHVLVGGWSMVALAVAWLTLGKNRPALLPMLPACVAAVVISLPGLLPGLALSRGVDSSILDQGNIIYVFQRLPHHLVLHRLPSLFVWRHLLLLVVWLFMAWMAQGRERLRRLNGYVLGGVLLAVTGSLLDIISWIDQPTAATLLRYYWFRLSDVMLPLGVALGGLALLNQLDLLRQQAARWAIIATMVITVLCMTTMLYQKQLDQRPGADIQSLPSFPNDSQKTNLVFDDWRHACQWIAANTPQQARVLTPRMQQTFKWYAGRSEIVSWKDIPQNAAGIVSWWSRFQEIYPPSQLSNGTAQWGNGKRGLAAHSDQQLIALARKYQAGYILIDQTRNRRPIGLPKVYPNPWQKNGSYSVYRVPSMKAEDKKQ